MLSHVLSPPPFSWLKSILPCGHITLYLFTQYLMGIGVVSMAAMDLAIVNISPVLCMGMFSQVALGYALD